jgi:hypothetical protein
MPSAREQWFAEILHAGLDTRVLDQRDILGHATPAVLTAALPRDVMVRVIEATLAAGTMSHQQIVDVVTIELLAEKVPPNIVWACISGASERSGIRDGIPMDEAAAREFLRRTLDAGLKTGVLTPKDVVEQVNAQVLGTTLPDALTTKLIEATLAAGKMNPEIIVETLGVAAITKHISTNIVWAIFVKPGEATIATAAPIAPAAAKPRPALGSGPAGRLEFVDDDVGNVLVELEDFEAPASPTEKPKSAPARPS